MKEYIKAGFGVTIGVALASGLVGFVQAAIKVWSNESETEETKSEEKNEND